MSPVKPLPFALIYLALATWLLRSGIIAIRREDDWLAAARIASGVLFASLSAHYLIHWLHT